MCKVFFITMSMSISFLFSMSGRRGAVVSGWTSRTSSRRALFSNIDYRSSSVTLLTNERMNAVMEGYPNHLSTLTKTKVRRMKKSDLQMELSFRGMQTKGSRDMLITRLMKVLDDDDIGKSKNSKKLTSIPTFHKDRSYILRVKGYTTQNSSGVGIGLVLYDSSTSKEVLSFRVYAPGDRSGFEAEYSAIIIGLDFASKHGVNWF